MSDISLSLSKTSFEVQTSKVQFNQQVMQCKEQFKLDTQK